MTERKGHSKILKQIINALREKQLSINELAQRIGSNWATVRNALEVLEDFDQVGLIQQDGVAKVYFLKKELPSLVPQSDTLFNLKLNNKEKESSRCLYSIIKTKWFEKTGKIPNKIQAQKVASGVANLLPNLKIPRVWYLYGKMLVLTYNPATDYSEDSKCSLSNDSKLLSAVESAVNSFSKSKNSFEIMKQQYETEKAPKAYFSRLELDRILNINDLNNNKVKLMLNELVVNLISNLPLDAYTEYAKKYLSSYYGILTRANNSGYNLNEYRIDLSSCFKQIWELIALYYLRESAKDFFDEITIRTNIEPKLARLLIDIQESLFELEGLFPSKTLIDELPKFDFLDKLKGSIAEKPARTSKERSKDFEEFEKTLS